ncbi:MAG: ATP-binding protein, partial [Planctomycetota bacterium]|nr:ATP-binding protein [Planctomycetota bacterium]
LGSDHKIVWGHFVDFETLEHIAVPDFIAAVQQPNANFNLFKDVEESHSGLVSTSRGPLLFAARPIVTSKNEGPIRGTVIFGRFLSPAEVKALSDRTHVAMQVWDISSGGVPISELEALPALPHECDTSIYSEDPLTLQAYTRVNDILGNPLLLVRANVPREISEQGRVSANVAIACSIAGGVLMLLALGFALQIRIVQPLQLMAQHAVRVGQCDNLKARLSLGRADAIGTLANEFNVMVENLAESRKKVLDNAHRAGMAEIASEVLHNVGNAVNSANCSIEVLEERLLTSKCAGLERAANLLREQAPRAGEFFAQDSRGSKLIEYLGNLAETLQRERADNQAEVLRLRETIRHIRDAIAVQQTFAGRSNLRQEVDLRELVNEILLMNQEFLRSAEVQVDVNLPPLPELQLNKSKMTQVLVNLVRNAVQAMDQQTSDRRRLTIYACCVEDDGIEIEVSDTGMGFSQEVGDRLFTHGFTTKPEGNGFGLHYCANAIRESGGNISAHSDGVGHGASFRILLPHVVPAALLAT